MRMSSVAPYKPLDNEKSPNPVQMISDDDSEKKSIEKPVKTESMKFLIPNEGSINKSPMSLFTKATRTNAFCTSQGNIREKSLSFNAYPRLLDNKRSTTPQQKNYLHAQFLEQHYSKVNFESVDPKNGHRLSHKFDTKTIEKAIEPFSKRSQTIKTRSRHPHAEMVGGTYILSKQPEGIGKIRQSIDLPLANEPDDFIQNDTDEQVTTGKKDLLHRNIDWKNDSNHKLKFPISVPKDSNRFKQHIEKHKKHYHKSNTYRSAPRDIVVSGITRQEDKIKKGNINEKSSKNKYYQHSKYTMGHKAIHTEHKNRK